jgi:hypothetical protein
MFYSAMTSTLHAWSKCQNQSNGLSAPQNVVQFIGGLKSRCFDYPNFLVLASSSVGKLIDGTPRT